MAITYGGMFQLAPMQAARQDATRVGITQLRRYTTSGGIPITAGRFTGV
jgi:hypothetical protein